MHSALLLREYEWHGHVERAGSARKIAEWSLRIGEESALPRSIIVAIDGEQLTVQAKACESTSLSREPDRLVAHWSAAGVPARSVPVFVSGDGKQRAEIHRILTDRGRRVIPVESLRVR